MRSFARWTSMVAAMLLGATQGQAQSTAADSAARDSTARASAAASAGAASAGTAPAAKDSGRLVSSTGPIASPIVIYSPETGYGGGAGLVWVRVSDTPGQRPTTFNTSFIATETSQFSFVGNADVWTEGNQRRFTTELTVQRAPNKFFGIGPWQDGPSEKFVPSTMRIIQTIQQRVRPHLFLGLRYFAESTKLDDIKPGPIKQGLVPGSPNGWYLSTISALITWDTRDRYYVPLNGTNAQMQITRADRLLGSEFSYYRMVFDVRHYESLGGEHSLALQFYADGSGGGLPPFERMPRLGGKDMVRGFFQGQLRDKFVTAFTAEYRSAPWFGDAGWQWWRLSGVAFAALGGVSPTLTGFEGAAARFAGGVGLRIALTRPDRLNLRIDRGWGRGSAATYFTVGEAF